MIYAPIPLASFSLISWAGIYNRPRRLVHVMCCSLEAERRAKEEEELRLLEEEEARKEEERRIRKEKERVRAGWDGQWAMGMKRDGCGAGPW